MRAALHASFGDPATVLSEGQADLPEPGPGEVRIRTVLAPIHNQDKKAQPPGGNSGPISGSAAVAGLLFGGKSALPDVPPVAG